VEEPALACHRELLFYCSQHHLARSERSTEENPAKRAAGAFT
jgi:hypothetical protein